MDKSNRVRREAQQRKASNNDKIINLNSMRTNQKINSTDVTKAGDLASSNLESETSIDGRDITT